MSSDKKINDLTNIQEDENGTRSLIPLLPKEFWGDKAMQSRWYKWISWMPKFFSHPFVLLALGGLLTGLLLPYITNKWQDHQKELDLKSSLTTQMTQSVASLLRELDDINLNELPQLDDATHPAQLYNQFIGVIDQWNIQASVIKSQLQLYLPNTSLARAWQELKSATFSLDDLYIDKGFNRQTDTTLLSEYLANHSESECVPFTIPPSRKIIQQCINWDHLRLNYTPVKNGAGLLIPSPGDFVVLEAKMGDILDKMVLEVLKSNIPTYS